MAKWRSSTDMMKIFWTIATTVTIATLAWTLTARWKSAMLAKGADVVAEGRQPWSQRQVRLVNMPRSFRVDSPQAPFAMRSKTWYGVRLLCLSPCAEERSEMEGFRERRKRTRRLEDQATAEDAEEEVSTSRPSLGVACGV